MWKQRIRSGDCAEFIKTAVQAVKVHQIGNVIGSYQQPTNVVLVDTQHRQLLVFHIYRGACQR